MISEFVFSIAMFSLIVKFILILINNVNSSYEYKIKFSKIIKNYFLENKCTYGAKCKKNYIEYKGEKIYIKKYTKNNVIRSKLDEANKKIFKEFKKKTNNINK